MQNMFTKQNAHLLHFTGLTKWLAPDGKCVSHLSWIWMAVTITLKCLLFPESHVLCLFWDETEDTEKAEREREKREVKKKKKIDRKEKTTSFLKSRVTLCWWTCGAHQDEKELPRLWNPPVKINILFKPLSGKGRGKMRESKKERERKGERGKERKRHRWWWWVCRAAGSFGLDR